MTKPKLFTLLNPVPPTTEEHKALFAQAGAAPNMGLICVVHMQDALNKNFAAIDYTLGILRRGALFRVNLLGMPIPQNENTYVKTNFVTSYVGSAPAPLTQPVLWDRGFSDPVVGAFPTAVNAIVDYITSKNMMTFFDGFGFCPMGPSELDGEFTILSRYTDQQGLHHDYSSELLGFGYTEQKVIDTLASIAKGINKVAPGKYHRFSWFVPEHQKLGYTRDPQCTFAQAIWKGMLAADPTLLLTPINQVMTATSGLGYTAVEQGLSVGRLALQFGTGFHAYRDCALTYNNCVTFNPIWIEVHPTQAWSTAHYALSR